MLADKIPDSWKAALSRIQTAFPEAVIAGGALRDLHFNLPPKDVDVFVRMQQDANHTLQLLREAIGYNESQIDYANDTSGELAEIDSSYADYNPALRLVVSFDVEKPRENVWSMSDAELCEACNAPLLNIIALDLPQPKTISWGDVVTNDFDLGLNRIYFDGKEVVPTIAFSIDAGNHTMTVLRCRDEKELERIKVRLARLGGKYPEFRTRGTGVLRWTIPIRAISHSTSLSLKTP